MIKTVAIDQRTLATLASPSGLDAEGRLAERKARNYTSGPINATIPNGILTMPDGQAIDLTKIQAAINFGLQETGEKELMEAYGLMSKITGLEQGPSGEFVAAGGALNPTDPSKMTPAWSDEHREAAQREGWGIFDLGAHTDESNRQWPRAAHEELHPGWQATGGLE